MAVKWTESQQKVIDSRNRNLLVSAAAGSGKTAVLVERIIQMISQGEKPLNIDQLLVMTFTKAAAAEMRERISQAVDQLLASRPEDEHLWLQTALIPQASITTIDSFCLNLIRSHYNTLDIDPAFRIGDEGELALLQTDVMQEMLEDCYQQADPAFGDFVEQFGRGKSDAGIEDVILQTWGFAQSHPWPMEWLESCRRELEEDSPDQMEHSPWMKFLMEDLGRQMEELEMQLSQALEICREENGPLAYEPMLLHDLNQVRAVAQAAEQGSFCQVYESLKNVSFDRLAAVRSKEVDQDKKAWVSAARDRVKKALTKAGDIYGIQEPEEMAAAVHGSSSSIAVLLDLARQFHLRYQEKKKERNVVDFNDLEHLALEVLLEPDPEQNGPETFPLIRRPTDAARELSAQYEEILVDEYQDSNYVQEALITSISRERQGHPNVFMVGDVKQSIYRFRLARPELFMEKYQSYTTEDSLHQKIELHQNFRSRPEVLESVNHVFYRIMTPAMGGIRYTKDEALYPGASFQPMERTGGPAQLLLADTGADSLKQLDEEALDYTSRELEARMIAEKIRELTDPKQGLLVWDKGRQEYRPVQLRDMTVLLRSMSGWSEVFVNVLMNEGIPAYAQSRTGYFGTTEVETVLSLLAVIDNPMQDIPLAAVMRSPIGGLDDQELAWLTAAFKQEVQKGQDRGLYGAWQLWKEKRGEGIPIPPKTRDGITEKLEALETLLEELRAQAWQLPVHELLYEIFQASGYYDYVSAMPAGETRRANLDMLVEKAIAFEATSYKGLFHFIRYIEKLKKYNTDFGEASPGGSGQDALAIMSIHASKGLEFPVVFLAGLGKRFNRQDVYGQLLLDADLGMGADFLDLKQRLRIPSLKKYAIRRKMEMESLGEELRILYVAMTRAKEKLIMTATDRSLASKLEKWQDLPLIEGQIPSTILSGASSCLDWLLMARPVDIQVREIPPAELVGREIRRQAARQMTKEDLLALARSSKVEPSDLLEQALSYTYPFQGETGLYAMLSVSELKKQGQAGQEEERIGMSMGIPRTGRGLEGAALGTACHRALECLDLQAMESLEDVKAGLAELEQKGYLDEQAFQALDPEPIWKLIRSTLGKRMVQAQREGRLHREQQFMIGIPAREIGRGQSQEMVLVQGVIDAWMEEPQGLVLIDYKTDRIPGGDRGKKILRERYGFQLSCYKRALEQITGKKVCENVIYSLTLQESILL